MRGHIGFDGLLLSDDLSMQALGGSLGERAARALAAGCDIALHCNGEMAEMVEVAGNAGAMSRDAVRRFEAGRRAVARHRPRRRRARPGKGSQNCCPNGDKAAGNPVAAGATRWIKPGLHERSNRATRLPTDLPPPDPT